jgi:membrane protein
VRLLHFKNAAVYVVRDMEKNRTNLMKDTILSRHSRLLTFGILFTLWSASSGFTALIDALNTAYDVSETRRYWKTRGLAILLTFSVGCLLVIALGMLLVGSSLGAWLTETFGQRTLWPYVRWAVAIGCTILAVELLYFVAPNVRQRFVSTLPGAVIAVGGWIGLSYLLGIYFQDFSAYSKGYGSLGVALAFSIWLYWTGFVILIGAQFNAELLCEAKGSLAPAAKRHAEGSLAA